jgi:PKD repeat protein
VAVGQPELSFGYVRTLGVTGQPYPGDAQHLNEPRGLYIDGGDNVYVAEYSGDRVLRYNAVGGNTLALGTAGQCNRTTATFCSPADVTADADGNLWVADGDRVVEYTPAGAFVQTLPQVGAWPDDPWPPGNDNTHFSNFRGVQGVAYRDGRLYVADSGNDRVQVYQISGGVPVYSTTVGVTGVSGWDAGHFNNPTRLAVDGAGRLYVADALNGRVQRCTFGGTWACATLDSGLQVSYWGEIGVSVDGSDNVYIADTYNGRIRKCIPGGACSSLIDPPPVEPYGLPTPYDVAVDSAGNIFVAVAYRHAVRKYDSAGNLLGVFAGVPDVPYVVDALRLNGPNGVAAAADGGVYVVETHGTRLIRYTPGGAQQWAIGVAGMCGDAGQHRYDACGVAIDSAGRVVVADYGNHRLKLFNPDGTLDRTFGTGPGQGPYELVNPMGVAVSPVNGDVLVADYGNQRVQVYTSQYVYKATLGVTGVGGADAAHFHDPVGVAVDGSGRVYVADPYNQRVQRCTLSGSTGSCGTFFAAGVADAHDDGFDSLGAGAVAVDGVGQVYVADPGYNRVQVFDSNGAYLTTLGGVWAQCGNTGTGELRSPSGVAVDGAGHVYVADSGNHRVQEYAPGVPGWLQANVNGFGDRYNLAVTALAAFGDALYAGTGTDDLYVQGINNSHQTMLPRVGAQLWRSPDGVTWTAVMTSGFGSPFNKAVASLAAFGGQLYVGTQKEHWTGDAVGGEVWRSADGLAWANVAGGGFGDPANGIIRPLTVFSDALYAATVSYTSTHGAEVWRSATGDAGAWTRVVTNGFGVTDTAAIPALAVFDGRLYAATANARLGGGVWRTGGGAWAQVSADGFGDAANTAVTSLGMFDGQLYASVSSRAGAPAAVWRCRVCDGTDWVHVAGAAPGGAALDREGFDLLAAGGWLYWFGCDGAAGLTVWRSADGAAWGRASPPGFGSAKNACVSHNGAATVYDGRLLVGTLNPATGGQVWEKAVTADFRAGASAIKPGGVVTFTNASAGDVLTSTWDFGDGVSITLPPGAEPSPASAVQTVTHVYAARGAYTVTLTVTDGVHTSTLSRVSYVRVYRPAAAYFTAAPAAGVLPLQVHFTDASSGDYMDVRWSFGDGLTSTARSPAHTYTRAGAYTVTLTVSGPVNTDSFGRARGVTVYYGMYLPIIKR